MEPDGKEVLREEWEEEDVVLESGGAGDMEPENSTFEEGLAIMLPLLP